MFLLIAAYVSAQSFFSSQMSYVYDVAQTPRKQNDSVKPKTVKGQTRVIEVKWSDHYIKNTDEFDYDILTGNVWYYHDGINLHCDSSHLNKEKNVFEAFGNVQMEQGDTLFLYGKYLHYDGNTKLARVRFDVRLEKDTSITLFTDSLDYDRVNNIFYYFDGGMLVDSLNTLTSYWGQYEPGKNMTLFRDSVKLVNPQFTLYSDTLRYNTQSKMAYFQSPTKIVSDSGIIHTTNGWYNTVSEESLLLDQSSVLNLEGNRILRGDSMLYNRKNGFGEVFGNMTLQDTIKKMILKGNYGFYDQKTDYAFATDSAYVIEYSNPDSLFLHADTLKLLPDSTFRIIKAYYGVRFYRADLQGICDSMQFNSRDSILHLYRNPVLWNVDNQLSGDTIDIFMNDSTIDYVHVKRYSFSIEQKDSIHFNQLKSLSLKVFFDGQKAKRILAEGSVESVVYPEDKDKTLIGLQNYLTSSYLEIFLQDGKMDKLKAWPKPEGYATPFHLLEKDMLRLKDFYWYDYLRPRDKYDIFRKSELKAADFKPIRPAIFDQTE